MAESGAGLALAGLAARLWRERKPKAARRRWATFQTSQV